MGRYLFQDKNKDNKATYRDILLVSLMLSLNRYLRTGTTFSVTCFLALNHSDLDSFKSLTANVPHHIEASQLICIAVQLTGFHMMGNIGR